MKLVIDIPVNSYLGLLDDVEEHRDSLVQNIFYNAIADGTPLDESMTNADKFKAIFGIYATELWAKSEKDFLEWLNAPTVIEGSKEV